MFLSVNIHKLDKTNKNNKTAATQNSNETKLTNSIFGSGTAANANVAISNSIFAQSNHSSKASSSSGGSWLSKATGATGKSEDGTGNSKDISKFEQKSTKESNASSKSMQQTAQGGIKNIMQGNKQIAKLSQSTKKIGSDLKSTEREMKREAAKAEAEQAEQESQGAQGAQGSEPTAAVTSLTTAGQAQEGNKDGSASALSNSTSPAAASPFGNRPATQSNSSGEHTGKLQSLQTRAKSLSNRAKVNGNQIQNKAKILAGLTKSINTNMNRSIALAQTAKSTATQDNTKGKTLEAIGQVGTTVGGTATSVGTLMMSNQATFAPGAVLAKVGVGATVAGSACTAGAKIAQGDSMGALTAACNGIAAGASGLAGISNASKTAAETAAKAQAEAAKLAAQKQLLK